MESFMLSGWQFNTELYPCLISLALWICGLGFNVRVCTCHIYFYWVTISFFRLNGSVCFYGTVFHCFPIASGLFYPQNGVTGDGPADHIAPGEGVCSPLWPPSALPHSDCPGPASREG